MDAVSFKRLRAIARHDGQRSWYQLDRIIDHRQLPEDQLLIKVLDRLVEQGLIRERPSEPQNKCTITEQGRRVLAELGGEGS